MKPNMCTDTPTLFCAPCSYFSLLQKELVVMAKEQAELDRVQHDQDMRDPTALLSSSSEDESTEYSNAGTRDLPRLLKTARKNNVAGSSSATTANEDAASVLYRLSGGTMGVRGQESDEDTEAGNNGGGSMQDSWVDSEATLTPLPSTTVKRRRIPGPEEKLAMEYLDELSRFRKMPPVKVKAVDKMGGPLKWWVSKEQVFPTLAKPARKYLVVQATSASSERLFSTAGNIVTIKRARLSDDNVESLVFLHSNQWMW